MKPQIIATHLSDTDSTTYEVVESAPAPAPPPEDGVIIGTSYQIGIVKEGTTEPIWRFRLNFATNYIDKTLRTIIEPMLNFEKRTIEEVQTLLAHIDASELSPDRVHNITMKDTSKSLYFPDE